MKKLLVVLAMLSGMVFVPMLGGPAASAATVDCNTDVNFFAFPTWHRGLPQRGSDCSIDIKLMRDTSPAALIWTIALNIVDIALRITSMLAVGFIIYGGFRYFTSQGNPDAVHKATDTLLKAVIGLVIALAAAALISFIVSRLNVNLVP